MTTNIVAMRDNIEKMSKFHQLNILKILNNNKSVIINENKNGIHINLSDLDENIIEELHKYVSYVTTQENALNKDEKEKESIKNIYFS